MVKSKCPFIMTILFEMTFIVGYSAYMANFGYLALVSCIPQYALRGLYYILGKNILERNIKRKRYWQILLLQVCYLAGSLLFYDGVDTYSATLGGLWRDPPLAVGDAFSNISLFFCLATVGLLFWFHQQNLKHPEERTPTEQRPPYQTVKRAAYAYLLPLVVVLVILGYRFITVTLGHT